jgi:hypothetical protein
LGDIALQKAMPAMFIPHWGRLYLNSAMPVAAVEFIVYAE